MHDEVGIVSPRDGHDAIVVAATAAAVRVHDGFEQLPAGVPIKNVLLFVDAAARANALAIEHQAERMIGRVEATLAESLRLHRFRHFESLTKRASRMLDPPACRLNVCTACSR